MSCCARLSSSLLVHHHQPPTPNNKTVEQKHNHTTPEQSVSGHRRGSKQQCNALPHKRRLLRTHTVPEHAQRRHCLLVVQRLEQLCFLQPQLLQCRCNGRLPSHPTQHTQAGRMSPMPAHSTQCVTTAQTRARTMRKSTRVEKYSKWDPSLYSLRD